MLLNISFHFDYFPLLVVAAIAWGTPILLTLFKLKKIPSVIFEILFGYFIGKFLLQDIDHESMRILEYFALTGFIFLMFLGGLEIDVDQILASLPRKRFSYKQFIQNPLLVGLVYFLSSIILAYTGTLLLAQYINIPHLWYFALIMVTTSVGIVVPVLKERDEIKNHYGQMIIIAAAIADILSIILFTFTAFIIKNGFQIELLYILGLFVIFILAYLIGNRLKNIPIMKKLAFQLSHAASQIRIRGSILLIMLFVVVAQFIDEEAVLLGAFLIGLILSSMLHRERSVMLLKLDGMGYGFFIPIFFIMVGVEFDPSALKEFDQSLFGFLALLLITLFLVKIIPSILWKSQFGTKKAVAGGFLMSSRLSLIIAASSIGLEMGVITPGINASFIIMAIITCFSSPFIFNGLAPVNLLTGDKTIIVGGSSTAVLLARRLTMHGKKSILVEIDPTRAEDIQNKGLQCLHADGENIATYHKLKLHSTDFVIVETGSPDRNYKISKMLRNELMHDNIITRSSTSAIEHQLKTLGVKTIDVIGVVATTFENLILRPTTYHALVESFDNFSVEEVQITNKEVDGRQLKEIPFHKDAILMMVKRDKTFYIPHGETYFRTGDVLHVFGTQTALLDTREKMEI
ncbi:MAG: monovalent cation:proton antiporter family protein [Saprospiraceae bacterium]|nr:monovalent cation:proton antiporter family protein [Saprospiraceae bacterium]